MTSSKVAVSRLAVIVEVPAFSATGLLPTDSVTIGADSASVIVMVC